jgi:hypothetical protein
MTYWHEIDGSPQKDIWHWVGVCNTQAQSIGLHRDPTGSDMSPATRRLRIRLWWSLYSRDRLIALALRRPTQINEGTCDVPFPRLSDFDVRPFHPAVSQMLQCPQSEDVSLQRHLAVMFIEKVKLCQCLGRVLFAQYSPSNHKFGATHRTTITLVPRQASEAELDRCGQKLDAWVSSLPKEAHFIPPKGQQLNEGDSILLLHSALLRMIYHATCSALHRPQALILGRKAHSPPKMTKWSTAARQKMQDAAAGTTQIVHGLNRLGLTKFLPASGLTVVLPAAVVHLTNLTSSNAAVRDESTWNFHRCIEVLNELKDIYPAADYETAHLEEAVKLQLKHSPNSIFVLQNSAFSVVAGNMVNDRFVSFPAGDHDGKASIEIEEESTPDRTGGRNDQFQGTVTELDEHDANTDRLKNTNNMALNNSIGHGAPADTSSSPKSHSEWDWNADALNDWLLTSDGVSESERGSEGAAGQQIRNYHPQNDHLDHITENIEQIGSKEEDIGSPRPPLLLRTDQQRLLSSAPSTSLSPLFACSVSSRRNEDLMVITGDLDRDLGLA